jgi:predicted Zn-dependent peptidase
VQRDQLDEGLVRTVLPSGLTVLTERLPGLRSAAVGVWVRAASAHEPPARMGVSHLLEHMVFKGTERRNAMQLAQALEGRGGSLDAFTSRDHTSFQAHVIDEDLPLAVDVLTDLVRRPLLRAEDLELERNVVLEEINGVADTPDDLVFEIHARTLWPEHPYGYSILGTPDTVSALGASDLKDVHRSGYYPGNFVIAAAGNVEHDSFLAALDKEGWFETDPDGRPPRPPAGAEPAQRGVRRLVERETAQAHIVLGTDTFESRNPRRYALALLTNAMGGGMSSRLFQRVREELGLAYAIFAYQHFYQGTGQLGVYVGTAPATAERAEAEIRSEFARVAAEGLTAGEVEQGKRQLKGQVLLALESPSARMHRLAGTVLNQDRYRTLDEIRAEIDAITSDDVAALAAEFFAPERQATVVLGGSER